MRRLYLDNAATSSPKPPRVIEAMVRYATEGGASPGRGSYREALEGARLTTVCRKRLCALFNGEDPSHVVFALNTTDALNLAIRGLVAHRRRTRPGAPIHAVTTAMDHNSVLRPLNALEPDGVSWTCVGAGPCGIVDPRAVEAAIRAETLVVAVNHASNVTGIIQPIEEIGAICRRRGVCFLVDGAQSLGHVPVDVQHAAIDLLAFPGHKGLLGPQGTGGLYIRPGVEMVLDPARTGGTGSLSELDTQPDTLPDKYESGSQNTMGIVGLSEGVAYLLERGMDAVRAHELVLIRAMLEALAELRDDGIRLIGPTNPERRVGVFSITHEAFAPQTLAAILEAEFGILSRAGLHCAPRAHAALGTLADPGAMGATRLSLGPFNEIEDITRVGVALRQVCRAAMTHE